MKENVSEKEIRAHPALAKFPLNSSTSAQLKFVLQDVLYARRAFYDAENSLGILYSASLLAKIITQIERLNHRAEHEREHKSKTVIDTDLIPAERQAELDEAIRKNEEATNAALRAAEAGIPKPKPGFSWRPSKVESTPGLVQQDIAGSSGLASAEASPDSEGIGPGRSPD